jgi:hypothetical protein
MRARVLTGGRDVVVARDRVNVKLVTHANRGP